MFTRGTTESINLVAHGWGRKFLGPGDEVLLTEMEHHSNIVPWQFTAEATGATLRYIPLTDDGLLDLSDLGSLLTERTKILAVTGMSNALGTFPPLRELIDAAHAVGAIVLVDGAQFVPHHAVDVVDLGLRLPHVLGTQDARPHRVGRSVRTRRAARRDGSVPRGRRDDPRGLPRSLDVQGAAATSSRPAR